VTPPAKTRAAIIVLRASCEDGTLETFRVHVLVMPDVERGTVAEHTVTDADDAARLVAESVAAFRRRYCKRRRSRA
jgi:hypothetical protein